jgi:hypothetical protein
MLPLENHLRFVVRRELGYFAGLPIVSAIFIASHLTGISVWRLSLGIIGALIWALMSLRYYQRKRNELTDQYLSEQNISPNVIEPINALVDRSYRTWLFKRPAWWKRPW